MSVTEVVEAEGHLIDSHIMENIFDKVVEYSGRFEVEQFRIGRTNSEPSYLRLKVETPDARVRWSSCCSSCWAGLRAGRFRRRANCGTVERDRCAPEDFYSTTNHRTLVRHGQQWIEVENQRMDAMIVVQRRPRVLPPAARPAGGRQVVVGTARHPRDPGIEGARPPGVRVHVERDLVASGRWRPRCGRPRRWCAHAIEQKLKVRRGGRSGGGAHRRRRGTGALIRGGWVQAVLERQCARRARYRGGAVRHLARRPPVRRAAGRARPSQSHARHQRDLSRGRHAQAVESGRLTSGILYECVKANVPFVLAGSLRDDGPLPDTITDMNAAQDAYAEQLKGAGLVLCLGSMLHSIATGNMLPSWVKIVCVDINPAVATKVSDRGTGQAVGVVTDVGLFLDLCSLRKHLA